MNKILLLFPLLLLFNKSHSQNISFEQVPQPLPAVQNIAPFKSLSNGDIAYFDVDNDSDMDVLITGLRSPTIPNTAEIILYLNNGNGSFTEKVGTNLVATCYGAISTADVDGDGDQDVFITGKYGTISTSKLYINNGNYTFTVSSQSFEDASEGDVEFADIDNDNDMDLLITGVNNSNYGIAKLYTNNGSGSFTLVSGTSFLAGEDTKISFFDIDNDSDQDLLIHKNLSYSSSYNSESKLYKNNGSGSFTLFNTFNTNNSSFAYADIDGDNDIDLLFAGRCSNHNEYPKLYNNNGNGVYTATTYNPFARLYDASFDFVDYDNDNDPDLILTGATSTGKQTKLYVNDSLGNFSLAMGQPFPGVADGQLVFLDIDTNTYKDVIVAGTLSGSYPHQLRPTRLYVNDSSMYSLAKGSPFFELEVSSVDHIDIDGDNDEDVLIMGPSSAMFYMNDGNGGYTLGSSFPYYGYDTKFEFADIDNDNDLDILVFASDVNAAPSSTKLYRNDGNGSFSYIQGNVFATLDKTIAAFGDVDGDGDLDLFLSGETTIYSPIQFQTNIYINNGNGVFWMNPNSPFIGTSQGQAEFADIDGDNDLDLFLTGNTSNGNKFLLYQNNGSGTFSLLNTSSFVAMSGNFGLADIDNDNDIDLLVTGDPVYSSATEQTILYTNNGSGVFTVVSSANFPAMKNGAVAFGDFDNDQDQDVILTGYNYSLEKDFTELYVNDGTGSFSLQPDVSFAEVNEGNICILDIDNDSKLDVIVAGQRMSEDHIARLYRNTNCNSLSVDTVIACNSYTWINGVTYTANNDTSIYIIPNAMGCDSIIRLSLTIDTLNTNVVASDPSISAVANNVNYQWLDCGNNYAVISGATSQTYTASTNGNYAVEITGNNCIDTSVCVTIVSASLNSDLEADAIAIYPNPVSGDVVNIDLGKLKNVTIKVFDVSGKQVVQMVGINTPHYKFNFEVPDGLYFLEIFTNAKKQRFKLIKQSTN